MAGDNGSPLTGIKFDLDGKIQSYLLSLGGIGVWPGRIYNLSRAEEREEAEAWVKELLGKVLNA